MFTEPPSAVDLNHHVPRSEVSKLSSSVQRLLKHYEDADKLKSNQLRVRGVPLQINVQLGSITSSGKNPLAHTHPASAHMSREQPGVLIEALRTTPWTNPVGNSRMWFFASSVKTEDHFTCSTMELIQYVPDGAKLAMKRYTDDAHANGILRNLRLANEKIYLITGLITVGDFQIQRTTMNNEQHISLNIGNEMVIMVQLQEVYFKALKGEKSAHLREGRRMKRFWRCVGEFEGDDAVPT